MSRFPPIMRTGHDMSDATSSEWDLGEWVRFMDAVFLAFAQKAFAIACQYAEAAGRGQCATGTDCEYGLKYAAHTFLHEDDFEPRTLQVRSLMDECDREMMEEETEEELSSNKTDSSDNEDHSSDVEDGECIGERRSDYQTEESDPSILSDEIIDRVLYRNLPDGIVNDSDFPPFCRAPETSDWVIRVHEAVDTWNEWNPSDPVERLLKRSISTANDVARMESERGRPDVAFRHRRSRVIRRSTTEPSE